MDYEFKRCDFFVKHNGRCQSVETRFIRAAGRHLCREHLKLARRNDAEWDEAAPKGHPES